MNGADPTEPARRVLVAAINSSPADRISLNEAYGQTWDTQELQRDFTVEEFRAPFVVVRRKADGVRGSMMFQHGPPRLYFGFKPE